MHINPDTALDLIEGRADLSRTEDCAAHLQSCTACREQMEEWRQMHSLLKRQHLASAPPWVMSRAISIIQNAEERRETSGIRQVIASLVFDSFAQPALAGARGAMDARQLVLRAQEFDIHLKIWGESEQRQLVGQILPRGEIRFVDEAKLHLLRNGERFDSTATDDFGEFQFKDIPQGLLSLQVDLPHLTVVGALNMMDMR
jgi:hypothetical protein